MRAIIIAAGSGAGIVAMTDKIPACMLPLVDKPFLQHVVEYLIVKGITQIDFVLSQLPEQVEGLLGDGTRWGAKFSFHPVRDANQPWKAVRLLTRSFKEAVLIADADFLPPVLIDPVQEFGDRPVVWMDGESHTDDGGFWTGWAACLPDLLTNLSDSATRLEAFEHFKAAGATGVGSGNVLSVTSFERLISAQVSVLVGWQDSLVVTGSRKTEGVVIGRGARIHPSAVISGPAYIGEFSEISKGVELARGSIVCRDCVVDSGCTVRESIIMPGTYVGKDLDVVGCLADHGVLYNARLGTEIKIADDFLIGRITPGDSPHGVNTIGSQLSAAVLLLFLWPLLVIAIVFRATAGEGDALFRQTVVRLPAGGDSQTWTFFDRLYIGGPAFPVRGKLAQFLREDLPGLINVLRGDMHLVGSPARSREEVEELEPGWRELYLTSKVGLVTEVRVRCGADPEKDEQHASDTFYAVNASRHYDFKLLGDFVRKQFSVDHG